LWDATDNGYMVHDFLEYNPSKEQALSIREARKVSGSVGGKASGAKRQANAQAKVKQNPTPSPSPYPLTDQKEVSDEFSKLNRLVEVLTGYPATSKDIPAINEMVSSGIIEDDLRKALEFFTEHDKVAKGAENLLKSAKFYAAKRIQAGVKSNGGKPKVDPKGHFEVVDGVELFIVEEQ
jgi:hypothetical protein